MFLDTSMSDIRYFFDKYIAQESTEDGVTINY